MVCGFITKIRGARMPPHGMKALNAIDASLPHISRAVRQLRDGDVSRAVLHSQIGVVGIMFDTQVFYLFI